MPRAKASLELSYSVSNGRGLSRRGPDLRGDVGVGGREGVGPGRHTDSAPV